MSGWAQHDAEVAEERAEQLEQDLEELHQFRVRFDSPLLYHTTPDGKQLLVYQGYCFTNTKPVLTVSHAGKWYGMYLVHTNGTVTSAPSAEGELDWWHPSHVPIPGRVQKYAEHFGYELDSNSFDMIVGRWMLRAAECDFDNFGAPTRN